MLAPETVLQSRYRIVRQLGQGGMGAVFEAIDERLDTIVALKETLFADERLRKQFEREARLLARLHHPALPRVSDHFAESEGQFLVMQFIPGEDLAEMIAKRNGPFPPEQVLSWADQLLDALDYLHTQEPQIIHRDIKPQNLKLTARGQIILLDFGLAKGQASEVSRVTTSASIFGYTPNYAPLEQVQGLGTDPRSDIYSLSATLYHLLTGVKPPDALTRAAALVNGQADPLLLANEINNAVPAAAAAVLNKAMSQNRGQRYPSAVAMRRALKDGDETITVANRSEANTVLFPPPNAEQSAPTQANWQQKTVADAAPATLSSGETTVVRAPASASRRSPISWLIPIAAVVVLVAGVGGFYAYRNSSQSQSAPAATAGPTPAASPSEAVTETKPAEAPAATPAPVAETKETAKKERAGEKERTAAKQKAGSGAAAGSHAEAGHQAPDPPEVDVPDVPSIEQRGNIRRTPGVSVRTFPDGSQLITTADGMRVLVRPDGTRQVLTPRQNPRRPPRRPRINP